MNSDLRLLPITRREALREGFFSAAGVLLGSRLARAAQAASAPAKAKAVIQIWMWGGPSHLDIFDPKPEAGQDYCGPLNSPIETNVSGIRISELLPLLAKQAHRYSIVRSMTHGINAHETAAYTVQTGRISGGREVYPSVGAVVSLFKGYNAGYKGMIPPYIVLTQPQGRFSEAGFRRRPGAGPLRGGRRGGAGHHGRPPARAAPVSAPSRYAGAGDAGRPATGCQG
jgi:hypothetical protein